jgi:predicted anti-sigma-YlaC factor YlaD
MCSADDHQAMNCPDALELVSAHLDGRAAPSEVRLMELHLATCEQCSDHWRRAVALDRSVRVRPAEPIPDLTMAILARARPPRARHLTWSRVSLAWIAVLGMAQAVPNLVLGHDAGASTHVARHVGALTIALFIGFAYAAWRPERAFGLLPVAGALAVAMIGASIVDVSQGLVSASGEITAHSIDIAGVALLWFLAGTPKPRVLHSLRPASFLGDLRWAGAARAWRRSGASKSAK